MRLFINDTSIVSQADSYESAKTILKNMLLTFIEAKSLASEKKGYITKNLKDKNITPSLTIQEIVYKLDKRIAEEAKLKALMIEVLMKRPFVTNYHINEVDRIFDDQNNSLKESCFDDASGSNCGSLVVSAINYHYSNNEIIQVNSTIFGIKKIMNISSIHGVKMLERIYEYNEKHQSETRFLNGEEASAMDLNPAEAQIALTNGILIGKRVYSFHRGTWYQFHPHRENVFHGFKLKCLAENNTDHSLANSLFSTFLGLEQGQVYSGYV